MSQHELQVLKQQINQDFLVRFSPVLEDLYADLTRKPIDSIRLKTCIHDHLQSSINNNKDSNDLDDAILLIFNFDEINFETVHSLFTSSTPAQQALISFKEDLWL
jgi:hypothetical protein